MRKSLRRAALGSAAALAGLLLTQCAIFPGSASAPRVAFAASERLLLRVEPFDSTVKAELARGGLDPARFEEDFTAELKYRFFLRRQEEALDSASADVILSVTARHLQPGSGSTGTFAAMTLQAIRGEETQKTEWAWRTPVRANVPPAFLARHLSRTAADEVLGQVRPPRLKSKEPPPPLMLMH